MKKIVLLVILTVTLSSFQYLFAFCGFYVAKADADLFNRSSEVIITRRDLKTVITMANDFSGDIEDFAMVVPVPEILAEEDIRIVENSIFNKLDAYSGPRLVEYFDRDPCHRYEYDYLQIPATANSEAASDWEINEKKEYNVTIEAEYTIGEYDIIILSAEESDGLERWLNDNNYKIPPKASDVLTPYIRSDMKFFIVKVNLEKQEQNGFDVLRPLQISFNTNRFMLPIRLGMANAEEYQDLIVYIFTENGRVETANYRTVKIPTNKNIPVFIKDDFGDFYSALFERSYEVEYKNAVFLEYSWDLGSSNFVKCDPCPVTPPAMADLQETGVDWITPNDQNNWNGSDYTGNVYMTRLHLRYDRANFPQDLFFIETPEKENFQGRYIITHTVRSKVDCDRALNYFEEVLDRRKNELSQLTGLTGWDDGKFDYYIKEYQLKVENLKKKQGTQKGNAGFALLLLAFLSAVSIKLNFRG